MVHFPKRKKSGFLARKLKFSVLFSKKMQIYLKKKSRKNQIKMFQIFRKKYYSLEIQFQYIFQKQEKKWLENSDFWYIFERKKSENSDSKFLLEYHRQCFGNYAQCWIGKVTETSLDFGFCNAPDSKCSFYTYLALQLHTGAEFLFYTIL